MRALPLCFVTLFVLTARAEGVSAQAATQDPQPPHQVFRAGVEVVRLDVRVFDQGGRPVTDIRQDELEVRADGTPRPILLFQHVPAPGAPYLELARRTIGAEVSTNVGAPRGHLYVLVFDTHHITPGNEMRARTAVEQFLRQRMRPGDRAALYALPGPGPQVDFTADVSRLVAELPKIVGSLSRDLLTPLGSITAFEALQIANGDPRALDLVLARLQQEAAGTDLVRDAGGQRAASQADAMIAARLVRENSRVLLENQAQEVRNFTLPFSDILQQLEGIEGRKSVILFSEGFFLQNVVPEMERVAAAAARASAVLYAFDLNRRFVAEAASPQASTAGEIQERIATLAAMALDTGGELVTDAGEQLDRALDLVASQSEDFYLVGFEPAAEAQERRGSYRRVEVRLRRPGVRVNVRTGYALGDAPTPADRRRSIDRALAAPFAQKGLPIEYTTYVFRGASPGVHLVFVTLAASVPVASGRSPGSAEVVFVVRSVRDGHVAASGADAMPLPTEGEWGSTTGVGRWRVQFELPPGEYVMRIVVREPGGIVGSADRRFDVRPLSGPSVAASDIVLGGSSVGALPVRATTHTSEVLTGALEVYARTTRQLESVSVSFDLGRVGDERPVRSAQAVLGEPLPGPTGSSQTARVELPLEGADPGIYVAAATVRVGGEVVAELAREVEVRGGVAPATPASSPTPAPDPALVLSGTIARRFVERTANLARATSAELAGAALSGSWEQVRALVGSADASSAMHQRALSAVAEYGLGNYAAAAAGLEALFLEHRQDADLAFLLGWASAASGDDRRAATAWRNAVRADASMVPAYLAGADAYLRLQQPALAAQLLKAGLVSMPDSVELRSRLAEIEVR